MTAPAPSSMLMVSATYHADITRELCAGAEEVLKAADARIERVETTGAFELPGLIAAAAEHTQYDGYVALGCVIRGETSHYELICREVARGLMDLSLAGVALGFGVLTCESLEQAEIRASRKFKNKGAEAARACLDIARLSRCFAAGDSG